MTSTILAMKSFMSFALFLPHSMTSSWLVSMPVLYSTTHMLVMRLQANTLMPAWWATIVSGMVLIPTASTPGTGTQSGQSAWWSLLLTKLPQHLQLGHSLVVWPPHHHVDPLPHNPVQVEGPRYLLPNVTELFVVKVVGGEKPWAEPAVVGSWMKWGKDDIPGCVSPLSGCWQEKPGRLMWSLIIMMSPTWQQMLPHC